MFVDVSLKNSHFFMSNENRFLMQYLADIIRDAIEAGIISYADLFSTESEVIKKLKTYKASAVGWHRRAKTASVVASKEKIHDSYCVKVFTKKRFIDPLVLIDCSAKRYSEIDVQYKTELSSLLSLSFNHWLYVVES